MGWQQISVKDVDIFLVIVGLVRKATGFFWASDRGLLAFKIICNVVRAVCIPGLSREL